MTKQGSSRRRPAVARYRLSKAPTVAFYLVFARTAHPVPAPLRPAYRLARTVVRRLGARCFDAPHRVGSYLLPPVGSCDRGVRLSARLCYRSRTGALSLSAGDSQGARWGGGRTAARPKRCCLRMGQRSRNWTVSRWTYLEFPDSRIGIPRRSVDKRPDSVENTQPLWRNIRRGAD